MRGLRGGTGTTLWHRITLGKYEYCWLPAIRVVVFRGGKGGRRSFSLPLSLSSTETFQLMDSLFLPLVLPPLLRSEKAINGTPSSGSGGNLVLFIQVVWSERTEKSLGGAVAGFLSETAKRRKAASIVQCTCYYCIVLSAASSASSEAAFAMELGELGLGRYLLRPSCNQQTTMALACT